jgi:4-hydroxybenzoate polyprenyltransferase
VFDDHCPAWKEFTPIWEDAISAPVTRADRIRGLVVASHPGPSLLIAAIVVTLAWAAGGRGPVLLLLGPAALLAQFSIGWSNDWFDAPNDIAADRRDKPIVAGAVARRVVLVAAVVALGLSTALAFGLGVTPGLVHVAMVAAGWAYNAGVKSTVASGALYLIGFGLIPVFSATALPAHPWPRLWTVIVAALLGLGAHFVNVLPDLDGDLAHGVRGLPQWVALRAGPFAVRLIAFVLLVTASAVITLAAQFGVLAVAALTVSLGLAGVGLRAPGKTPFFTAMAIAALDVALFVANGSGLVA